MEDEWPTSHASTLFSAKESLVSIVEEAKWAWFGHDGKGKSS
jgi:hypothetical protein